jgi:hypothetical protein
LNRADNEKKAKEQDNPGRIIGQAILPRAQAILGSEEGCVMPYSEHE